jgi:hypothetical protein
MGLESATAAVHALPEINASQESSGASVAAQRASRLAARVAALGATSIVLGILWDISWHRTIGRDTFWTPAHLAIYLGGILGGATAGWLIFQATLRRDLALSRSSVGVLGLKGPMGAWVCVWGALAMLTSAPFDNWWHDAYGLDVKILSPPHTVLALGMFAIVVGALLLALRAQAAPSSSAGRARPSWDVIYLGGVLLTMVAVFHIEESWPNQQHNRNFYLISSASYPIYMMALGRASGRRWGATGVALVYMLIHGSMVWLLPLFPGQPRLGPIYNPVTHFVPLAFPLLLVIPAFGLDLARWWIGHERGWIREWLLAIAAAVLFVALLGVTQWNFSAFLMGPGGQNWFFAADRHWAYTESLGDRKFAFWSETSPRWNVPATRKTFVLSGLLAFAACRLGLWLGNWMWRVRR